MSGLKSRRRGMRGEYMLRNALRVMGWTADRVPSSGAAQGFRGDVRATRNGQTILFEMKNHSGVFKKIYDLYFAHTKRTQDDLMPFVAPATTEGRSYCVSVSTSLDAVLEKGGIFLFPENMPEFKEYARTFTKICGMQKLLGEADVLVLKDDRQPLLYVSYK